MNAKIAALSSTLTVPSANRAARWQIILCLALLTLLPSLSVSIANIALPTLAREFSISVPNAQWIVISYLLATTVTVVAVGRAGDIIGSRKLALAGLLLFIASSLSSGFAPNVPALIVARALQGFAGAMLLAAGMMSVRAAIPQAEVGQAMGFIGAMSAFGTALGPAIGGWLITHFGWRAIFLVNVPLAIFALGFAARAIPMAPPRHGAIPRFDYPGAMLLAFTVGMYAMAFTLRGGTAALSNLLFAAGAFIGAILFVRAQQRASVPLVRLSLLRDTSLRTALSMNLSVSMVMMGTLIVGPFYLTSALGLSPAQVGVAMSVGPIVAAIAGWPVGKGVDRYGAARMTAVGLMAILTGAATLAFIPLETGVSGYLLPIMIVTAGYAQFQAANSAAIVMRVDPANQGALSGLLTLSRNLGLVGGATIMGSIFAFGSAVTHSNVAANAASGMHLTFRTSALLILIALWLAHRSQSGSKS